MPHRRRPPDYRARDWIEAERERVFLEIGYIPVRSQWFAKLMLELVRAVYLVGFALCFAVAIHGRRGPRGEGDDEDDD